LAWPHATFAVLVRVVAWVLLLRGVIDFVRAMEERHADIKGWWLTAVAGIVAVGIALWAIRYVGRSIVLLVLWIGIALLMRGMALIMSGFNLRPPKAQLAVA